jgi:hypothetical protein
MIMFTQSFWDEHGRTSVEADRHGPVLAGQMVRGPPAGQGSVGLGRASLLLICSPERITPASDGAQASDRERVVGA